MKKKILVLSLGYWFSSRSLGLLLHPYATMRAVVREKFMRPLVVLPGVIWVMGWMIGIILVRGGIWLDLGELVYEMGLGLVFLWLWVSVFLIFWQGLLLYLFVRFGKTIGK